MVKALAADRDTERSHVGKVGGTEITGMMDLIKVDFFGRSVGGPSLPDAALQRSQLALLELTGVLTLKPLENRLRLEPRRFLELLLHFRPDLFEGIEAGAPSVFWPGLAGEFGHRSVLPCGLLGHPGSGGGCRQRQAGSEIVFQLRDLLIRYHCNSPLKGELRGFSPQFQPVILIVADF
jgi:hypothetical protein